MAEPQADHDPTMEEILQSIKRIIAEDGAGTEVQPSAPSAGVEADSVSDSIAGESMDLPAADEEDDILDLTDLVEEEVAPVAPATAPAVDDGPLDILSDIDALTRSIDAGENASEPAVAEATEGVLEISDPDEWDVPEGVTGDAVAGEPLELTDFSASEPEEPLGLEDVGPLEAGTIDLADMSGSDVLTEIMQAPPAPDSTELEMLDAPEEDAWNPGAEDPAMEDEAGEPEEVSLEVAEPETEAHMSEDEMEEPLETSDESMMSDDTAEATAAAFQQFIRALPTAHEAPPITGAVSTRKGTTVEELLVEAMKPMLRQWMDEQLPQTVERIVQAELRKLLPK